jgi:hypothetical protein
MIDPRLERLMNEVLDGVATPEEARSLEAHLAVDAEARAAFEQLQSLATALRGVPMVDPPPDLKGSVLRSIRGRTAAPGHGGWLGAVRTAFRARPALGYGYTFAAGLAAGIVGLVVLRGEFLGGSGDGRGPFGGTMLPPARLEGFRAAEHRTVDLPGCRVAFQTLQSGDGLAVRVDARSDGESEIDLLADPAAYRPIALRRIGGGEGSVSLLPGGARIVSRGDGQFMVYCSGTGQPPAPLRYSVRCRGVSAAGELRTSSKGAGE